MGEPIFEPSYRTHVSDFGRLSGTRWPSLALNLVIAGCAFLTAVSTALVIRLSSQESRHRVLRGGSALQPEDVTLLLVLLGAGISAILIVVLLWQRDTILARQAARARTARPSDASRDTDERARLP